jgi:hypothetical protein
VLVGTAALVAAVAILVGLALPPKQLIPSTTPADGTIRGVFHIHSNRSDGRSSPDEIAAIAARAGLKFIVFTDHGDATRTPDTPSYRSGVLCIDAVEISTSGGHLVALGLPAAPYPLAGEPKDVLEDVHRLGGFGIAAHPDSPKEELRWRDWSAPIDGVELINLDTVWRMAAARPGWQPGARLLTALLAYPFRSAETIANLLSDNPELVARWQSLSHERQVPVFVGLDAHARLELRGSEPGDNRFALPFPSYDTVFRTVSLNVTPAHPLTGNATEDVATVLDALRRGHSHAAVDGVMASPSFQFFASNAAGIASEGDELIVDGPLTLTVRSNAASTFTTNVYRDAEVIHSASSTSELAISAPGASGSYRVEVRATDRRPPPLWILSNPVYLRERPRAGKSPVVPSGPGVITRVLFDDRHSETWRTEASAAARSALDVVTTVTGRELRLRYALPGGLAFGEYAAAVVPTPGGLAVGDRLVFTARAERPMRISVQFRVAVSPTEDERWQRSVYLDPAETVRSVAFDEFKPVGPTRTPLPPLSAVHSVVFVVERGNTKPGSSGRFWLSDVTIQR